MKEFIHVLLVEDDAMWVTLFRRTLAKASVGRFEVDAVDRMSTAVQRIERGDIDVIVLDLALPDSFGVGTLKTMRQAAPTIPIVVLTGQDDDRVGLQALNEGAHDYLVKGEDRAMARSLLFAVERRRLQEALRRRDALLAEAEQIAQLGSYEWDIAADQVTWSDELFRIFGVDKSGFKPTYQGFLDAIHPDDRERVDQNVQASLRSRQPSEFEHRIVRGGEVRTLHARGRVVVDDAGRPTRLTGTGQDVTERKKLEEKLLLAGRMSSVGTLAAGVAHEINNPLAYVVANLEFVGRELRAGAAGSPPGLSDVLEALDEAQHGADRIRRIVSGVKTFSRADEERRVPVEVKPVIELSIQLVESQIRHRASLVREYGPTPLVDADESRLSQVFVNLLINAAQAITDRKSDDPEIRIVTSTDDHGCAIIEVRDNGPGIAEANRSRIFDPFFTTKAVGVGTGLGLSICHGIVTTHGGEITFETVSGLGTSFRVMLPPARLDGAPRVAERAIVRVPGGRRGRVLVVDDEPMVVSAIRRILGGDHEITAASNGVEAMERFLAGERFDVVLCDVMMPVMDGIQLYDKIAQFAPDQADKIVFITGGAYTPPARAFLDRMPHPRTEKPFNAANLRGLVRRLVR